MKLFGRFCRKPDISYGKNLNSHIINLSGYFDTIGRGSIIVANFDTQNYDDSLFRQCEVPFYPFLTNSVSKRKSEFLAGRYAARLALSSIGSDNFTPAIAKDREPQWPPSYIGSISHSEKLAICAVSMKLENRFVGIDVENLLDRKTASEVKNLVLDNSELALFDPLILNSIHDFVTICFSAKESIFKALFPMVRCYFGFEVAKLVQITPSFIRFKLDDSFCKKYKLESIPHVEVLYEYINDFSVLTYLDSFNHQHIQKQFWY